MISNLNSARTTHSLKTASRLPIENSKELANGLPTRFLKTFTFSILLSLLTGALDGQRAMAQDDNHAQKVKLLRQQLNDMQAQMLRMQSQLDQLEGNDAAPVASGNTQPTAQSGPASAAQPPVSKTAQKQIGQATERYTTFSEDSSAAPRFDNLPLDPKYHGFFRLPGTQTILKIGGYAKSDFIYDLKPAGNTAQFIPASFPVPQAATVNNQNISIQPTRLSLDFRIPKSDIGEVRFYLEGDLFGTNATTPRLRHAYAQAGNFLIGQTFTNFMDPDGVPDTLDFAGPNGLVTLRNPQFRYGFALSPSATLYLAVERPSSDVSYSTSQFTLQPHSNAPDGTVRIRQEFERGHIQVAGLFRSIDAFTSAGETGSVFGWGANASSGFQTFGKDNMILAVAAGHGISRYIQDTSGLGIDAEVSFESNPHLEATPALGIVASYQHYWIKSLRSSGVYSYAAVENNALAPSATYNHGNYGSANLIWNPFGSLNVGAEVLYGALNHQAGKADATRIQLSAKYSFVKVDPNKQ